MDRKSNLLLYGPAWRFKLAYDRFCGRAIYCSDSTVKMIYTAMSAASTDLPRAPTTNSIRSFLYAQTLRNNPRKRLEVEARILANQPVAYIAEKLNCRADVIRTYERAFFDIRDKLKHSGYVCNTVIYAGPQNPERIAILQSAFHGGTEVVDHWFLHYDHLGQNHNLKTQHGRDREMLDLYLLQADHASRSRKKPERAIKLSVAIKRLDEPAKLPPSLGQLLRQRSYENLDLLFLEIQNQQTRQEKDLHSSCHPPINRSLPLTETELCQIEDHWIQQILSITHARDARKRKKGEITSCDPVDSPLGLSA
jgi:hypothetical protein